MKTQEKIRDKSYYHRQTDERMSEHLMTPSWSLREKVALTCRILTDEGHESALAGQITARADEPGTYWMLSFGLGFDEAQKSNIVRVDDDLNIVEGEGMPNPSNRFHLWIYRHRPEVNAIVHTHPPHVSALSMLRVPLNAPHMDTSMFYEDCAWMPDYPGVPIGDEEGRPIYLFSTDSPLRSMTGDFEAMALYAGQGVGRIMAIEPAGERLRRIAAEAAAHLRLLNDTPVAVASPVCYAGDAERERHAPLIARLDELLEAERAGARVALRSRTETEDEALRALIDAIHRDEVKWCGMLMRAIRTLEGTPGSRTGDFYDKAMAVPDLRERLAFLNRGQGWVAKKLRELLPLVDDAGIRAGLQEMLQAHVDNLDKVNTALGLTPPRR